MSSHPVRIGEILSELMARRGYAGVQAAAAYAQAWQHAAGPLLGQHTRVGPLRRGTLEIVVSNSTMVQELVFQKITLLETLAKLLPEAGIKNLRFRVGTIS
jgi:predicted nucleic acid-binding Zn ribbon protein